MKAVLIAGALVGSVVASFHNHNHGLHQHHKRGLEYYATAASPANATCGVMTYTTYLYGAPTLWEAPTSTPCTTSTSVTPTSTQAPVSTYSPKPSSTPSSAPASSAYLTNGNLWGMTYTPYDDSGHCKSAAQVHQDIAAIRAKGFTTVRTYSTDCSGLQNIGSACTLHGMQMILGVYISSSGIAAAQSQVQDIIDWGKWNMVEMIVVGNECVFNGWCSGPTLAGFIASSKAQFRAHGYKGPVTTSEPLNILQEIYHDICGVIDVIGSNIESYFNNAVAPSDAGDFVLKELAVMEGLCPGKTAYNLETGWPSKGAHNGAAIPGYAQQKQAIASIIAKAGAKSIIFSFGNDPWKEPGEYGVEQYFGCLDQI